MKMWEQYKARAVKAEAQVEALLKRLESGTEVEELKRAVGRLKQKNLELRTHCKQLTTQGGRDRRKVASAEVKLTRVLKELEELTAIFGLHKEVAGG